MAFHPELIALSRLQRGCVVLAISGRARYQVRTVVGVSPNAVSMARFQSLAAIAQLVEHVIRNDGVGGSSPSCGTI